MDDIEHSILSHYSSCDYKLDDYLESLPFSGDYLRKLFQKEFGVTPHQYLTNKRLQIAAEALGLPDAKVLNGWEDPYTVIWKEE